MSEAWCQHAFHSLMVTPSREVRPCCRFLVPEADRARVGSVEKAADIFSNGYFQTLRQQMNDGQWAPGCQNCAREEAMGFESMRLNSARNSPHEELNEVKLTQVEFSVGRLCNLKCRTCGSHSSTKWDADETELGTLQSYGHNELDLDQLDLEALRFVRKLKITGGEPLLHPQFLNLLRRLAEAGLSQQMEIELFTNGTTFPAAEVLENLASFARADLWLSLDGVGPKSDYVRGGSHWRVLSSNSLRWQEWIGLSKNRRIVVAATVSALNVFNMDELVEWASENLKDARIFFQPVHEPSYLSVFALPLGAKAQAILQLRYKLKNHPQYLKRLESFLQPSSSAQLNSNEFFLSTRALDQLRGENFAKIFPEWNQVLCDLELRDNREILEPSAPDLGFA